MTTKDDSILGLDIEDSGTNPVVSASYSRGPQPQKSWSSIKPDDIGAGFQPVDESLFDNPADMVFVSREFKNKFVIGRSRFITFQVRPRLKPRKVKKKPTKVFNENTKVTKSQRKAFATSLGSSISDWRSLFVSEILPVTLSIQTAAEEIKEQASQLVDDAVSVPTDYIKIKALQAVQLRILRALKEQFKLTTEEALLLSSDFLPKLPPVQKS